jgi:hypothetical protein
LPSQPWRASQIADESDREREREGLPHFIGTFSKLFQQDFSGLFQRIDFQIFHRIYFPSFSIRIFPYHDGRFAASAYFPNIFLAGNLPYFIEDAKISVVQDPDLH